MKKIYPLFFLFFFLNLSAQSGTYYLSNFLAPPYNFTNLDDAIGELTDSINSPPSTLIINANISLSGNLKIPKYISLKFLNGFKITIPGSTTLTLNCPIDAGAFQIFAGSGKTNGYPLIENAYPEWWKEPIGDWSDAIQKAVDFYSKVFFSSRDDDYIISRTINLDLSRNDQAGYMLTGVGRGSIIIASQMGFVFKCINTPPGGYIGGLKFENLSFFCNNGISIEAEEAGFGTMDEGYPIQNVKINSCRFHHHIQDRNSPHIAIDFKKVFDSEISNNYILDFGTGIRLRGSDINTIKDNRIMNFNKYAICDLAFGTFGSQNTIIHNDLLGYKGDQNKGAFIKSTSRHIIIRDNYLENQPSTQNPQYPNRRIYAYIDCSKRDLVAGSEEGYISGEFTKIIDITGNRSDVENNTCTNFIYFINERFKSLNLIESPNISAYTLGSTFCSDETSDPVSHILFQMDNINHWDKIINIQSDSFIGWENFSTSRYFRQSSNGDIIIDPSSLPFNTYHGQYLMQKFNSRGFLLNKDQSIFIRIDQKPDDASFGNLPKNINLKIKVRNYRKTPQDPLDTNANDLYFSIKTSTVEMPLPLYWTNIEIPNGDNFATLSVTIPYPFSNASSNQVPADYFDPSKIYYIAIAARNSTKEIKEIILVDATPVVSAKKKTEEKETSQVSENEEEEATEEIQRIIVDNEIKTYPNPVKDKITFEIKEGDSLKAVELYDINGKFIQNLTDKITDNSVDISTLGSGTYFVKIISLATTSKTIIKK